MFIVGHGWIICIRSYGGRSVKPNLKNKLSHEYHSGEDRDIFAHYVVHNLQIIYSTR